jgi:hypothetical protein
MLVMSSWRIGEVFVLRHAGFPFDWLEDLGLDPVAVAAANRVLDTEEAIERRIEGDAGPRRARQAAHALRSGRDRSLPSEILPYELERWQDERAVFVCAYDRSRRVLETRLRARAADERVAHAVFLSNPDMYENVWARFAADAPPVANAKTRRNERQVYAYLQRLCAKNETASFFGPMGYGVAQPGPRFEVVRIRRPRRRTFFAVWAVRELAGAIERDELLWPDLPARTSPSVRLDGVAARTDAPTLLSRNPRAVLLLGGNGSRSIAARAAAADIPLVEAVEALRPLVRAGAVHVGLEFEEQTFETFEALMHAVRKLAESPARGRWLDRLARLNRLRGAFSEGDLGTRRAVLGDLERQFTDLTGRSARRGAGELYADRFLVYEEAASPFGVRISRDFQAVLASELTPTLDACAAYGARVHHGFEARMRAALGDGSATDFVTYAARAQALEPRPTALPAVRLPGGDSGSTRSVDSGLFGAPTCGPRYALPDIFIAARSPEAIRDGDGMIVLGRVHHHLLLWGWLCAFFDDRPRVDAMTRQWLTAEGLEQELVGLDVSRRNKGFYVFPGRRLCIGRRAADDAIDPRRARVVEGPEGPELLDEDDRRLRLYLPLADFVTYPPLAALAHPLVLQAPIAYKRHCPRIEIGGVVYQRERWRVSLDDVATLDGASLFLAVHRLRRSQGWPRFVFARTADERKPVFLDTLSPFALELLRHLARESREFVLEEMLPGPADLWLRDDEGRRFTCELRMQATRWSRNGH